MGAIITKTTSNGEFVSTNDSKLDSLDDYNHTNVLGSNYLKDFYNCYNNLDVKILNNNDLRALAYTVNNFKLEIETELYNR